MRSTLAQSSQLDGEMDLDAHRVAIEHAIECLSTGLLKESVNTELRHCVQKAMKEMISTTNIALCIESSSGESLNNVMCC